MKTTALTLTLVLVAWSVTANTVRAADPSCFGSAIQPNVTCPGEQIDVGAAVNAPSSYAWKVFAEINQAAFPGNAVDVRRIWEVWKSADDNSDLNDAIYLNNGQAPQQWTVKPRAAVLPKPLVPLRQLDLLRQQTEGTPGVAPACTATAACKQSDRARLPRVAVLRKRLHRLSNLGTDPNTDPEPRQERPQGQSKSKRQRP